MSIVTTCIGAWPKPGYLKIKYFEDSTNGGGGPTRKFSYNTDAYRETSEENFVMATREAVADQLECGVDIPTDGEQKRENYIHYHCRHLEGIDFDCLTRKVHRNGAAVARLPTITGKIVPTGDHFLDHDFKVAQRFSKNPVKITVPGPLSTMDTTANIFYRRERDLAFDLADAINYEVRALAEAGCKYIQVDEPLFVRNIEQALDFGIECVNRCFDGVPSDVTRIMHMCCGYPGHLDDTDYLKADPKCYFDLAKSIDHSAMSMNIHQVSIEDSHCKNDLTLLENFQSLTVILGSVAIASSKVETVEEITMRIHEALNHIDKDRLAIAPDCGLMMLDRSLAKSKLKNMCDAARSV